MLRIDFYYQGVCGPAEGFRLYDQAASGGSGELLAEVGPADREIDIAALDLPAGRYTLGLAAVDQWGQESEASLITLVVGEGGETTQQLRRPRNVQAVPIASGGLRITFGVEPATQGRVAPSSYELAFEHDPETLLATIDHSAQTATYRHSESGLGHDLTRVVMVRSRSGDQVSPWVLALAAVTDSLGPDAPRVVRSTVPCCSDCG